MRRLTPIDSKTNSIMISGGYQVPIVIIGQRLTMLCDIWAFWPTSAVVSCSHEAGPVLQHRLVLVVASATELDVADFVRAAPRVRGSMVKLNLPRGIASPSSGVGESAPPVVPLEDLPASSSGDRASLGTALLPTGSRGRRGRMRRLFFHRPGQTALSRRLPRKLRFPHRQRTNRGSDIRLRRDLRNQLLDLTHAFVLCAAKDLPVIVLSQVRGELVKPTEVELSARDHAKNAGKTTGRATCSDVL